MDAQKLFVRSESLFLSKLPLSQLSEIGLLCLNFLICSFIVQSRYPLNILVIVSFEPLFDQKSRMQGDVDFWHVLGCAPTHLLKIESTLGKVFKPDCQLCF